ncbi:MAG TPA: M48 family metallopeptidase [Steroidobacteraceae bacterium]|jgi:predicted Zn-dependent protease|nr:M48 family metallopeptidase [Steroidobacteraceae bacterium]
MRTPRHLTNTFATAITAVLLLVAAGCETVKTTNAGAVGVDRKQQMLVDSKTIDAGAAQAYDAELKAARDKGALNTDKAQLERVTRVAKRIVAVAPTFRPDAASWNWQFNVQKTDELNAYCMPGGRIMVYSGLIDKLDLSDAELATVLGHEIAHALREHTRERVSRDYAQQLVVQGAAAVTGVSADVANIANMVGQVTFQLPFSREQESEADTIGLELMARAGYDPHAALTLWNKMSAAEGAGGTPKFLSTHPPSKERMSDLEKNLPRVLPLYQQARRQGAG